MTVRGKGSCPRCKTPEQLLYRYEPTDETLGLACPECIRARAKLVQRTTPCDECGRPGAWRNPRTRRNEYLCGSHHVASGDGVLLNVWFPRVSKPLNDRRPKCTINDNGCRGEVKPRGPEAQLLCVKHAGKKSAAWAVEDGEV